MTRIDVYANFRFRLMWEGRCVAGFSVIDASGQPEVMTLERGVSYDREFESWVGDSQRLGEAFGVRDFNLDVFNDAGEKLTSYRIHSCHVANYLALPYVDRDKIAVRTLKLGCEGWEQEPG